MFKNLSLRIRTKSALKKNKRQFMTVPFQKAERVAILVQDLQKEKDEFVAWLNELNKSGKKTDVIHFVDRADVITDERIKNISKHSFDWKGKVKDDFVEKFLKTEYDYLFSLHTSSFLPFEIMLAKTRAKCRIGQFIEKKDKFLDIMIQPAGNSLRERTNNLLAITKHT